MYLQTDGQKCHTIIRPSGKRSPNDYLYFYSLMDIEDSRKVHCTCNIESLCVFMLMFLPSLKRLMETHVFYDYYS